MKWYLEAIKRYADFGGRSSRKEYWLFTLFNMLIILSLLFVTGAMSDTFRTVFTGLLMSYCLLSFIPGLAVSVRRLHDTNRSGWWMLLGLIPFGGLVLLYFMVLDSVREENQFGISPKLGVATA